MCFFLDSFCCLWNINNTLSIITVKQEKHNSDRGRQQTGPKRWRRNCAADASECREDQALKWTRKQRKGKKQNGRECTLLVQKQRKQKKWSERRKKPTGNEDTVFSGEWMSLFLALSCVSGKKRRNLHTTNKHRRIKKKTENEIPPSFLFNTFPFYYCFLTSVTSSVSILPYSYARLLSSFMLKKIWSKLEAC